MPREMRDSEIKIAPSLVRIKDEKIPIRIVNFSNKPKILKSGMIIGNLQRATIEINAMESSKPERNRYTTMLKDSTHLSEQEKRELENVLLEYNDIMAAHEFDLGDVKIVEHAIITTSDRPITQRAYTAPPKIKDEIKRQVKQLIEEKIVRCSTSPWSSPIVPVKKKDGEIRMCIDYRALNAVTKRDTYPLPKPQEMFDQLGGCKYFTKLDANKGFYQIKIKDEDIEKTAFTTGEGLYEFEKMPFGLTNAPATFQRMMNQALIDTPHALVYMDDIIIKSKTFKQHIKDIKDVLQKLRRAGIKIKPTKCEWARLEIIFLGHKVSGKGLMPDPEIVIKVQEFPVPKNIKEVQSFLGLAGYYRRFQKDYSKIAIPLTNLTKIPKDATKSQIKKEFKWPE